MVESVVQRRLAAILAADVVGYSRLMEQDEAGTLAALKTRWHEIVNPLVAQYHGRVIKVMGDGLLVEFGSAVNAVTCAIDMHKFFAEANGSVPEDRRIILRIGINLGDVIVEGGDLYGDGVNIATRLEALAEPGSTCVSRGVYDQVKRKLDTQFSDLGQQIVKNIVEPVHVYRVGVEVARAGEKALALPDKPSIAVLPFENISGDPEQEYFADGMVEEIITGLSRMKWLFVIARNSSFIYKGRATDVRQVGRELGVRYVLEGSVRKAGTKVRITGQLIDTSTSVHLWADRFDGEIADVFTLQDQVTACVVGAIAPKVERAEIERTKRKRTENLDAYDYYLRGMAAMQQWTRQGNDEALAHFGEAVQVDPGFATAYGMAARCYTVRKAGGWMRDPAQENAEAEKLARRAVELGADDAIALCTAGFAFCDIVGDYVGADALVERALVLNPNLAMAWLFSGWVKVSLGEPDAAIERVGRAMRLSPQDPQMFSMQNAIACAHFVAGRYSEALSWAKTALREQPSFVLPNCIAATSAALAGRLDEAQKAIAHLRQIAPELTISNFREIMNYLQEEDFDRWFDGLRRAGLPE